MLFSFSILYPEVFLSLVAIISVLSFVGWALVIVIIAMLCMFVIIIVTISNPISRIGEYYEFKGLVSKNREPLITNFKVIFLNNLLMTLPLYFSFMYLLNPLNFLIFNTSSEPLKGVSDAFIATMAIIPGYLLSIRLLTHPVRKDSFIPAVGFSLKLIKNHYTQNCSSMKVLKERFMSFYFSLTASAFFVMAMFYLYKSLPLGPDVPNFYMHIANSLVITFVPIFDLNPFDNISKILFCLCAYLIALAFMTISGEKILIDYELLEEE